MSEDVSDTVIFECQMCGKCCNGYGGTFVSDEDIEKIAAHIGVSPETFVKKYCSFSGRKPLLAQKANGFCVFFNENCTIHPVKPRMCRQWPYLPSILIDIQNWYTMAADCPGIRTDLDDEVIRQVVRRKLSESGQAGTRKGAIKTLKSA